ncbi:MAG: LolA family protein, partial [Gemmatimonadales bacterium]
MMTLLAVVPSFHRAAVHQDPWPILDRATQAYDSVRNFAADFVQIIDNPMLGAPDTTRGRMFQRRPNHFAMRFLDPRGDRIVADGRHLWLYTPSSTPGQVI